VQDVNRQILGKLSHQLGILLAKSIFINLQIEKMLRLNKLLSIFTKLVIGQ
jgi:hypothetical protein